MSVSTGREIDVGELVKPLVSFVGLVVVWFVLVEAGMVRDLPGPLSVAIATLELVPSSNVHSNVIASLRHIYIPYLLAVVIGVPLGIGMGWNRTFSDLTFPSLEILRPVPPIAWLPIVILVFPTTVQGIMFITFLGAFFPIVLNTISGVKSIDQDYVRAVRCLGGSRWQVIREVVVPAALPGIHTGLIVGMGLAWINLVAAEMIASEGLGRFVWVSYTSSNYPNIIFSVLLIGALGYASSEIVRRLGNRKLQWAKTSGQDA